MIKPTPTRTLGPLHLEDLEPHRFEDLVRQLLYDFRNWRALEPTGRSGSDEGFDARGFEVVPVIPGIDVEDDEEESENAAVPLEHDRAWLIQCKREKQISPKKLVGYLKDIPEGERTNLHGLIFVGASDFSKLARDAFRAVARELGFAEAFLWGKADVEDMLFQPKNDHLLFAYFGVSLQMRKRQLKTDVRTRLATKRKAVRLLSERTPVLIRDATEDRYPFLEENKTLSRIDRGRWVVRNYEGCHHDGLHIVTARHFAFLDQDGVHWDYAEMMDDSVVHPHENPWHEGRDNDADRRAAHELWNELPEDTRAWFEIKHILPFENILDIDEKGDDWAEIPHIYTTAFHPHDGPFRSLVVASLETIDRFSRRYGNADEQYRVVKFGRQKKNPRRRGA